jgi:hypothetical protein
MKPWRRAEIQKERERITQMRDAIRHRRELERIRKNHEKAHEKDTLAGAVPASQEV